MLPRIPGLPAWVTLYKLEKRALLGEAVRSFINCPPGLKAIYSDIGYIVLTALAEKVTGERIDRLFARGQLFQQAVDCNGGVRHIAATIFEAPY